MKIGAIILAAGSSRRFGDDKRKFMLDSGKSVLESSIEMVINHFADIMVVLRFGDIDYAQELDKKFNDTYIIFYNAPDSALGMAHSLSNAIYKARDWDAAALFLGDMPYLQSGTIELLLNTYANSTRPEPIVVPTYEGSYGHPVIFHQRYFSEITRLKGDSGAKSVLQANRQQVIEVPTEDPGIARDIDRPEEVTSTRDEP